MTERCARSRLHIRERPMSSPFHIGYNPFILKLESGFTLAADL
jgi:hypothetical protein